MSGKRYTDEFKIEAFRQGTDRRYSVIGIAGGFGSLATVDRVCSSEATVGKSLNYYSKRLP